MLEYAEPVTKLIDELKRLPSIGQKSAQRLAFYLMRTPEADIERLIAAMREVKQRIVLCSVCNNLTEIDPCRFCSSPTRDHSVICVVEEPHSLVAVEKTRSFKGVYHVLHGSLSPIRHITTEGEATANYISRLLKPLGIRVTRIAMGMPVGGDLEYVDEVTMDKALSNRHEI
jgi:recombination protein RecR